MCLAVPGKVLNITERSELDRVGQVNFSGVMKSVQLAYVPECKVGDYVLVHAGFAISILDEQEAAETLASFEQWAREEL